MKPIPMFMKGSRAFLALLSALLLTIMLMGLAAQSAKAGSAMIDAAQAEEIRSASEAEQGTLFTDLVLDRMKYVTSRSLCAKKGEWLAFVDVYEEYNDGVPRGQYVLQRGTLQYGLQPLPESAKSSTLFVGSKSFYIKAEKQSMFTFRTPLDLPNSADTDAIKMSVSAGKQNVSITLDERYPNRDFENIQTVLEEMAPAYVDYAQKRDGAFDHAFLRLRSYVTDTETLGRAYSWELTLVAKDTLPSKAIVIRYDCDTGKVASAVNREIRSYFG